MKKQIIKYKITSGKYKGATIEVEPVEQGIVTDFEGKKLEWSESSEKRMTWEGGKKWAESLGEGWRLPTIEELHSIVDHTKYNPACKIEGMQSNFYWSATTYQNPGNQSNAWFVHFGDGFEDNGNKGYGVYVRCVRELDI